MLHKFVLFFVCAFFFFKGDFLAASQGQIRKIYGISADIAQRIDISEDVPSDQAALEIQSQLEALGYVLALVQTSPQGDFYVNLGNISEIKNAGVSNDRFSQAKAYFEHVLEGDPHLNDLDRALMLTNDMGGTDFSYSLSRKPYTNDYILYVQGDEKKQFGYLSFDTPPREKVSKFRTIVAQRLYSLAHAGDTLRVRGTFISPTSKSAQTAIEASYKTPIGSHGLYGEIEGGDMMAKSTYFDQISHITNGETDRGKFVSALMGYPIVRFHDSSLYLSGEIGHISDESGLLGRTSIYLGRLGLFKTADDPDGQSVTCAAIATVGKSRDYNDQEEQFVHLRGGVGWIHPVNVISPDTEIRMEFHGQIGSSNVPNAELFFLGKETFLRGYRTSAFSGRSGLESTIELARSYQIYNRAISIATPYVFFDTGFIENKIASLPASNQEHFRWVSSVGCGTRLSLTNNASFNVWGAIPLSRDSQGKKIGPGGYLSLQLFW